MKILLDELLKLPDNFKNDENALTILNKRWNRNVLIMGDLNDNPYDKSDLNYLHATPDKKLDGQIENVTPGREPLTGFSDHFPI